MRSRPADAMELGFQCVLSAIDSGFHVVPAGLGYADFGADGDSVTNVRFSEGPGTKIAAIKLRGKCDKTMSYA